MKYLKTFELYSDVYINSYKNNWELILSNPRKIIEGENLIKLVNTAYSKTKLGSFIKTIKDVLKSHWFAIDIDNKDDFEACIFYREPRKGENWKGKKIQGIGHDGSLESKRILMHKLVSLLEEDGNWIEASDKMENILNKFGCTKITDIKILELLFPNSTFKLKSGGQYERIIDGKIIIESTYGKPIFK